MKKRNYKEQERQRHYYFFDYLFWLGEMAWWHYKGEPNRPKGESMLMLCIMIFIYEPIFLTTAHFLFGSTVFEWFTVAMIAGIVAILHYLSNGRIYPFSRREAVMQHYEGRRFSPFRCYFFVFSLGFLMIAEMYLLPSTLMRIDGRKAEPVENTRTEVPQRWRDYLALHITVGARQEVPSEALQYLINQDGRTSRYGQPVYVMQVREEDMGGEFRVGLLNHATFDEIQDGSRKFVECTWVKGYTPDSIRVLLTGWYEVKNTGLCPVDSLEWTEDTDFKTYKSMKRAETGRPHLFRLIAMIHKTAYILAYDMLRRKGGHDWVERRAGGIIGLPYLSLILVALLTLKDDPNNGQKIVTGILIGWAVVAAWCISGFQFKPSDWRMEIREELDLRPLYWKKAIEVYYAVVIAVAVVAGIVMPNV